MLKLFPRALFILFAIVAIPCFSEDSERLDPLAILHRECVSCHTDSRRRGGLLIDSRESLLKGGDTDAAIVPGKASESFLVETLFPDADPHMPPKSQLDPREIALIEEWVNAGAEWDEEKWAMLSLPERTEVAFGALPANYTPATAITISPDRSLLAFARGNAIDWYRIRTGEEENAPLEVEFAATSRAHNDVVQSLAFSPDGKTLVSGGFRSLFFWDPANPAEPTRRIEDPFLGRQTAVLFLEEPLRVLVADSLPAQLGRLHEIPLGSGEMRSFDAAHLDSISALALSPDGKRYATASADKLVTVRDAATHEILNRLEGHTGYALGIAFSPGGDRLASVGDDGEVKIWELESNEKVIGLSSSRSGPVYGVAWFTDPGNAKKKADEKDAEKAAAINTDRIFAIPQSGKPAYFTDLNEHEGGQRSTGGKETGFDSVGSALFTLAVHSGNHWTFAGGENGNLYVWDEKGKLKETIAPPAAGEAVIAAQNE